jgi:glycopeptide antibiotics resistance protein
MTRLAGILWGLAYVAILALVAFSPVPVETLLHIPVPTGSFYVWEAVANVALFVPFGFIGMRLFHRAGWVVAAGVATSVLVELAQLVLSPARVPEVADVVKNTLGTLIGCGLATLVRRRVDAS